MDLRGVRSLKTKWVQNTSPEVMNSVFPKANFFLVHPVYAKNIFFPLNEAMLSLVVHNYRVSQKKLAVGNTLFMTSGDVF